MKQLAVEQALYHREHEQTPVLEARSPGFADEWLIDTQRLMEGFGQRTGGVTCPIAIFAQPLGRGHVAVVRAVDREAALNGWPVLEFHFAVLTRADYEAFFADPFAVAERLPVATGANRDLPTLTWPAEPPPPRTVAGVQAVLQRIKAGALREDEDPEAIERTVENSESPALLGGAQVLVDGGKLVFVRGRPDNDLIRGLWTLLPHSLRAKLWPASFAFSNDLAFDVVVVPRFGDGNWQGYTTEEQAESYPAGSYELALQTAAEAGDQAALDHVFVRRTSGETLRLALHIVIFLGIVMLALRFLVPTPRLFPVERRAEWATAIVAIGNPMGAASLLHTAFKLEQRDKAAKQ